jgi:hypothetical protein
MDRVKGSRTEVRKANSALAHHMGSGHSDDGRGDGGV